MKILFVTDLYPLGNEKIAKALFYFVREWQRQGHIVDVIRANFIVNTKLRGRKIYEEKIYNENGIQIYNLNFHTPFLFDVYKKLPHDFKLSNYDVMISHMPCGALMANRLLEKEKIKYICGVHASDITVLKSIKYIPFGNALKKAYNNADKIAARSPVLKKEIEKIIPNNKTFIAYSGIDENIISKEIILPDKNHLRITTVASLIKRKNIDIIIKAVKKSGSNINLNIIGSGREEKRLKRLAQHSPNIIFHGELSREEVLNRLRDSDIFILISSRETFGLSYLEAMAAGNIIIAKENDGIDGILENNKNGFLIKANSEELKKCLEKIINLQEEEIAEIKRNCLKTAAVLTNKNAADNYLMNIQ